MTWRCKLVVAYLGTPFHGWQRQDELPTVQGEIEAALRRLVGDNAGPLIGAGRTDAGVHASGQTAHVDLDAAIPPSSLVQGLNALLPPAIVVRRAVCVPASFHARHHARLKRYVYRVRWRKPQLPWVGLRSACLRPITRWEEFIEAAEILPGRRDMASFTVAHHERSSTVRQLFQLAVKRHPGGVTVSFSGDGFLRYQVRRMMGALLEVGWGKRSLQQLQELLEVPQPGAAIKTAPSKGLTLEAVVYRVTAGLC